MLHTAQLEQLNSQIPENNVMAHTTVLWIWNVWRVDPGQQSSVYQPLIPPPPAGWGRESEEQNQ